MSTPKSGFNSRTIHFTKINATRLKEECLRRKQARGGACYPSEVVNEILDATLPPAEGEPPVIPIKKVKRKTRTASRLKQLA